MAESKNTGKNTPIMEVNLTRKFQSFYGLIMQIIFCT